MPDFSSRSHELELMDHPIEDESEIFKNFNELVFINTYLGGAVHSHSAISSVSNDKNLWVADIGSGAGDFLNYLNQKTVANLWLSAVDLMPQAHAYAKQTFQELKPKVEWIEKDYRAWLKEGNKPDVIHASLFCHHLTDQQFIEFVSLSQRAAKVAVVINDLHRHWLAYYSIKWLTQLFSHSRFTKNDAPLSVLRGFKRSELKSLLKKAGIENFTIKWKWAFRYIVIIPGNG